MKRCRWTPTVNLLERIDRCLNDTQYRLQQSDFEDCAAALVGHDYPGLVPVTGGTDHGLDAELVKPNGQVLGLIITSSRTWDGAKRSLRGSLKSARDHNRRVDQVVVANLAEVNPWGGASAHGHAVGATGAGLMSKLLSGLDATNGALGMQVMTIGHGQATVTIVERL